MKSNGTKVGLSADGKRYEYSTIENDEEIRRLSKRRTIFHRWLLEPINNHVTAWRADRFRKGFNSI